MSLTDQSDCACSMSDACLKNDRRAVQTLKHACRRHGILRWPNRQLFGYQRSVMAVPMPAAGMLVDIGLLQGGGSAMAAAGDHALCLPSDESSEHSHQSGAGLLPDEARHARMSREGYPQKHETCHCVLLC